MGRCWFTDEAGRFVGIEHLSYYKNHQRVLEVAAQHYPAARRILTPEV
jgi:hypothetical protein